MRVTSKGQVTIPVEIREKLGIHPGTRVVFAIDGDSARITKAPDGAGRGHAIVDRLRGSATVRMTTDEIMALTRGRE